MRAHALVHVEESSEFRAHVLDLAGLVAAVGLDRVAVDGVTHPQNLQPYQNQVELVYEWLHQVQENLFDNGNTTRGEG